MMPSKPEGVYDPEIELVAWELARLDPDGSRFARVLRETLDQLLDGRRTGRWDYTQLHKTEKTHMGTLVEINLHKEFSFEDGNVTDYQIAGIEVDCKFSQRVGGWEMGPEMVGHLCLVVTASDGASTWRAGLVRASVDHLRTVENRDAKRRLSESGVAAIKWLWPNHGQLDVNLLLHLDPTKRERIMTAQGARQRHGQARIYQLFRDVQGVKIRRTVLETVGYGLDDPMKRARGNGGARDALRPEGILVLGHQDSDPGVADALELPVPDKGELVAARVVPRPTPDDPRPAVQLEGDWWVVARADEPIVPAPRVPRAREGSTDTMADSNG
jgi:hypothetical protein